MRDSSAMHIREIDPRNRQSPDLRAWVDMRFERLVHTPAPAGHWTWDAVLKGLDEREVRQWDWRVWLAEWPGESQPVGYAELSLCPDDDGRSYAGFFVRPGFRRRGIGTALFNTLKTAALQEERHQLGLQSWGIPADPANGFFRSSGNAPILGTARTPVCRIPEVLEKLNSPEWPPRPELLPSVLQPRLSPEDFTAALALGDTSLLFGKEASPDSNPYEHYLCLAEEKERHGLLGHRMILRTAPGGRPVASVVLRNGDTPTARAGGILSSDAAESSMALAVVEALFRETTRLFPHIEWVLLNERSLFYSAAEGLGSGLMVEFNQWRIDI